MAFDVESLRKVGGFNVSLGMARKDGKRVNMQVGEEADVCVRMLAAGMKIAYSAKACASHFNTAEMSRPGYIRQRFIEGGVAVSENAGDSFDLAGQTGYYCQCIFRTIILAMTLRPVQAVAPYLESITSATAIKTCLESGESPTGWRMYLLKSLLRNCREFYRVAKKAMQ